MKRAKFNLSHYKLLTCDMGELVPLTWFEVIPGDSIQQYTAAMLRCSPLNAPVMHPVRCRIHHFFVPYREIWDDWEDFITGGPDGDDNSEHPYIESGSVAEGSLADYLGVPPATYSPDLKFSALPFRAYAKIYNEMYRDQDLVSELTIDTTDGEDTTTNTTLQKVSWEKDYFTTARSDTQKGSDVTIPLGTDADVVGDGNMQPIFKSGGSVQFGLQASSTDRVVDTTQQSDNTGTLTWEDTKLIADLTNATGIDINDLRLALSIQRYQEARQKYGSRYVEYLRYLGVRSSDGRLNEAEYLGGGRQTISFSEVLATDGSNTGQMYGHGLSAMRTNRYRRFFEEHGMVMTMMSVLPKAIYAQGLHRSFSREVKEDYFQRELQFIGEQEVYNKEVYTEHTTPDGVFGYQSRYNEYRTLPSQIHGEFRDSNDHWHYARIFSSDPALNSTFVNAVPTKRVNQSTGTDCLYIMANHSIQARRMLSPVAKPKTF